MALDLYQKCRPHPNALYQLGYCYHTGAPHKSQNRLKVDLPRAFQLYTEACEGTSTFTAAQLAADDPSNAVHNTCDGGTLESFLARTNLAAMWIKGEGVPDLGIKPRKNKNQQAKMNKKQLGKYVTPRHVTSCHVTSRHVTSRHARPRRATSRHVERLAPPLPASPRLTPPHPA